MSRQYPIWNEINSCAYKQGKSYGVKQHGSVTVHVGTSAKNSEVFLIHTITKATRGDYDLFRFSVDDVVIKSMWHKNGVFYKEKPEDCPE